MDEWWFKGQVNELRQPHGICIIIDLHGFYIRERQFVNRNLSADGSIVIMVFMSVSTWVLEKNNKFHGADKYTNKQGKVFVGDWV